MPGTKTVAARKQAKDLGPSSIKRVSPGKANRAHRMDITPGSTRFMQRYLGNSYMQSMSAQNGVSRATASPPHR